MANRRDDDQQVSQILELPRLIEARLPKAARYVSQSSAISATARYETTKGW